MQITTYSGFSKRENSTKQPTGGTVKNVVLKEECDIYNPIFELSGDDFTINYVQAFGMYYYATPVSIGNGLIRLICQIDPMASFKASIGAYHGLIEYTSSSSKVNITDPRNRPTMDVGSISWTMSWVANHALDSSGGIFVLSYVSNTAASTGVCTYAAMDWGALGEFSYNLFTSNILQSIIEQFTNMKDSLVSLMWLPIQYNNIPGSVVSDLYVGNEQIHLTNHQAKIITQRTVDIQTNDVIVSINGTGIDAGGELVHYIYVPPYTTAELYLPYIGMVPINEEILAQNSHNTKCHLKGGVDILTGDIVYELILGDLKTATFNGNLATHLPMASNSYNAFGAVGAALTAIGGAVASAAGFASGNLAIGAAGLATAAHSAISGAQSLQIHSQINGSNSSALGQMLGTVPKIYYHTRMPAEKNLLAFKTVHGMPYFEVDTVSNLSGFVKCADASVSIAASDEIKRTVNTMMNSGFYYE